jgi:hypothetical protein
MKNPTRMSVDGKRNDTKEDMMSLAKKKKTHQHLLQPIRDLAQIVSLHRPGQMVVRVVDPEVRRKRVEG